MRTQPRAHCAPLHRQGDGRARSVVHENKELQQISAEECNGLLTLWLHSSNPDKRSAHNACEVDAREADAGKDESAREKRVRVDSPDSADLRDANLVHAELLDYTSIHRADTRTGVDESQARDRRRNRRSGLLKLGRERGGDFDLDRDDRPCRLKRCWKRLMWMRRRSWGLRRVSSVIDGHRGVQAPMPVHSAWARHARSA